MVVGSSRGGETSDGVTAVVVTSLETEARQIRQFAFDGDETTFFESAGAATPADDFTLVFDRAVTGKSLSVTTGKPDGTGRIDAGRLEIAQDGKTFVVAATFSEGKARVDLKGASVQSVRIRPLATLEHPLVIREIVIESDPVVIRFTYPVEFEVDVRDAPGMKGWAEEAARLCERWYPRLNEDLKSEGYTPSRYITITFSRRYRGVAEAYSAQGKILASVGWFKSHPEDVGALIHETTHIVQNYRGARNPGWLVEGLDDYIRYFVFEPGKNHPIDPDRARYNAGYGVSAAFLSYVTETYKKDLIAQLNRLMREGTYTESTFQELTGKNLSELDEEWRQTLKR